MRIVYVCNEYPPRPHGGIGTYYKRCARAMVHAGHEVTVVGMGDETAQTSDFGVRVQSLRKYPIRALAQFGNRRRLHQWLMQQTASGAIDIVELPDFQGFLPYALKGCPVVVRLHMTETIIKASSGGKARPLFRRFERQTLSRHRHWLACSNNVLQRTIIAFGIHPDKATVVYSPLTNDSPGEIPAGLPDNYVLFAGSVSRTKGTVVLAEAAKELLRLHPDLHLIYAGPVVRNRSDHMDDVIGGTIGIDCMKRVHFTGRVPNNVVLGLMQRARAFVLPSQLEAFPLVVTEAMAMGCPTITFAVPPFTEFIEHDKNGILVTPSTASALSSAMDSLIRDPDRGRRIGETARCRIQELCSEESFVRSTLEFYEDIIVSIRQN